MTDSPDDFHGDQIAEDTTSHYEVESFLGDRSSFPAVAIIAPTYDSTTKNQHWHFAKIVDAATFAGRLSHFGEDAHYLCLAVENLWNTYRFNQHYIGYLAGTVSEKEFTRISRRFALRHARDIEPQYIDAFARAIYRALPNEKFAPDDLAVIMGYPADKIELSLMHESATPVLTIKPGTR